MDGRDIRAFTPVFDGLCPGMTEQGAASMRNRAGNSEVGRLMEFLTALGEARAHHGEADEEAGGRDGRGGGVKQGWS